MLFVSRSSQNYQNQALSYQLTDSGSGGDCFGGDSESVDLHLLYALCQGTLGVLVLKLHGSEFCVCNIRHILDYGANCPGITCLL